jgi:DNA-binding LacI/PurR family transcriptional regulator
MADVAAHAGVSLSTVSLTYSGAGPISPDMKARVEKAATDLGYAGPSPQGRALRSGRSGVVGLVVHEKLALSFRDPITLRFLDALMEDLGELGVGVLLIPTPSGDPEEKTLLETAPMDAAVVVRVRDHDDPSLSILRRRGIPFAIVEGPPRPGVAAVNLPDREATAELIRHLMALGHTRIATVTLPWGAHAETRIIDAPLSEPAWTPTLNRLSAFELAGIEPCVVVEARASIVEEGMAAGHLALADASRPTAVVCQSDLLAGGVILAARELDLDVPGEISVTGFDGLDLAWLAPLEITTMTQDAALKGHLLGKAVQALLSKQEVNVVELPLEFRIGSTTAAARER